MKEINVSKERIQELTILKEGMVNTTTTNFVLVSTEKGYNVKEISTFLNKPYREVFGIIWRKKNNYKQPKKVVVDLCPELSM